MISDFLETKGWTAGSFLASADELQDLTLPTSQVTHIVWASRIFTALSWFTVGTPLLPFEGGGATEGEWMQITRAVAGWIASNCITERIQAGGACQRRVFTSYSQGNRAARTGVDFAKSGWCFLIADGLR